MGSSEHEWLSSYRQGDVEALGKLVEHFRRPLFGFILKMTEGRGDPEEVFQEVWFRVIKNLDTYREDKFLSWLFRIAHNLIIDRARKARPMVDVQPQTAEPEEDALESRLADPAVGPAIRVAGRDLGQRIADAVSRLPVKQREVFVLRMEGFIPFKEIARIQGTSINTALARMQYALAKLKEELKEEYEGWRGTKP